MAFMKQQRPILVNARGCQRNKEIFKKAKNIQLWRTLKIGLFLIYHLYTAGSCFTLQLSFYERYL